MASIMLLFASWGYNNFYVFVGHFPFLPVKSLFISMANYSTELGFFFFFFLFISDFKEFFL